MDALGLAASNEDAGMRFLGARRFRYNVSPSTVYFYYPEWRIAFLTLVIWDRTPFQSADQDTRGQVGYNFTLFIPNPDVSDVEDVEFITGYTGIHDSGWEVGNNLNIKVTRTNDSITIEHTSIDYRYACAYLFS